MARMTFRLAIAAAALAVSSSAHAQQIRPEDSFQVAAQLMGELNAESGGEQIAALKRDFNDFAATYLTAAHGAALSTATPGAVGTSGRGEARTDWRAKYQRVEADLATLIGPVGAPSTASAVSLDPDTRRRLETVRTRLQIFYAATLSQPDGNPVAHTGAPPSGVSELPDATRAAVPPTAQAPQTQRSESPAAVGTGASAGAQPAIQVDMQLDDALAVLNRIQRILDDAIKEPSIKQPGKVILDRGSIDEMRAEIAQIRIMLQSRAKN
ncbi:MAG TPA: hypothetical protein VKE96_17065 [Vicinamibacterales bacterium]|nr:hypothetical protein [Vicinamibacterales bacterium]